MLRLQHFWNSDAASHVTWGVRCSWNFVPTGSYWLLVAPGQLRHQVIRDYNDDPTPGNLVLQHNPRCSSLYPGRFFFCGDMNISASRYISCCEFCQCRKHLTSSASASLQFFQPLSQPFERIGADLLSPFPCYRFRKSLGHSLWGPPNAIRWDCSTSKKFRDQSG